MLPDKFVAGGIIAKLPPSWNNFATSLKHKRQEFSVADLIGTLDVEEKARAKDTRARVAEGASRARMVQKKNFQPNKFKNNKNKTQGKGKFDAKNKPSHSTNFKKNSHKKGKGLCMSAVILITRLRSVLTALRSANMRRAASPLMLSSVILI